MILVSRKNLDQLYLYITGIVFVLYINKYTKNWTTSKLPLNWYIIHCTRCPTYTSKTPTECLFKFLSRELLFTNLQLNFSSPLLSLSLPTYYYCVICGHIYTLYGYM